MINLFETFNGGSRDFLRSQIITKMKIPTVVMYDDGWLPDEADSPIQYFCDLGKSNHPALYFDQVKVPSYWRITATATGGEIWDLKTKRGEIKFVQNDNKRLVKEVHWFNDAGQIAWIDHYDRYGRRFAKTIYSQGVERVREYFDRRGRRVITHSIGVGDVFLEHNGHKHHFATYPQFIVYFLKLRHYKLDHIFYNTLNQALGVSLALPNDGGEDVLFWNEPMGNELPGNMAFLVQNDTRTKHIVFQNWREWQAKKDQLPKDGKVDFQYLGMVYPHPRGNSLRPNAMIITNSDKLNHIEDLARLLPNITFNILAVTNMSQKLLALKQFDNVKLYPRVNESNLLQLLKDCDVYLDINQGNEILDAVRGAFEQNMLIVGFNDTLHEPQFVAQANVFAENNVKGMAQQIVTGLVSPKNMGALVDEQRKEASDVWPKDYERVLGKWVK
jgi:accessory Sec system glycosyltransferase GtfB